MTQSKLKRLFLEWLIPTCGALIPGRAIWDRLIFTSQEIAFGPLLIYKLFTSRLHCLNHHFYLNALNIKILQTNKYKPVVGSIYSMVVEELPAPTKWHQSCIHQISHLMVHHEELQVPSIPAIHKKNQIKKCIDDVKRKRRAEVEQIICWIRHLQSQQQTLTREMCSLLNEKGQNHRPDEDIRQAGDIQHLCIKRRF